MMILNDLERECQAWLDARHPLPPADDPTWTPWLATDPVHAHAILTRYRTLQQAISVWASPPQIEVNEAFVASLAQLSKPVRRHWHPSRWAIAATLLVGFVGLRTFRAPGPKEATVAQVVDRPLNRTLSQASHATLQLARATGEPAARLGLSLFEKTDWSTSPLLPEISIAGASETLIGVSRRAGEGVRPLGGSARKAFGFLIAPVNVPPNQPMPAQPEPSGRIL